MRGEDKLEQGRERKLTEKGAEERLKRFIGLRRRTLATLTRQIKEIETLKCDAQNVESVQLMMESDFAQSLNEFNRFNFEVCSLLSEDEKFHDQNNWYEPKMDQITGFMKETKRWLTGVHDSTEGENLLLDDLTEQVTEEEDTVLPSDSVSQIGASNVAKAHSHVSNISNTSRVSSTRARQEAEHAALMKRQEALKKKTGA